MLKLNSKTHNNNNFIVVKGAREHNLKNIDVSIPKEKLTVITGLSGSGKSSLAFNTIFHEGQRRYMESFSIYARQYIGQMEKPDVDEISGLSPVISIEQKTTHNNARSTVGTVTEIYDYLRLLFSKVAIPFSYITNLPMIKMSFDEISQTIISKFTNQTIEIAAPLISGRKGIYTDLFRKMDQKGFSKIRIDGVIYEMADALHLKLDRFKNHNIEVIIDFLIVEPKNSKRVQASIEQSFKMGQNSVIIIDAAKQLHFFSLNNICRDTGISYPDPSPNTFSFNSPYGWCEDCKGLGFRYLFSITKIIEDDNYSINAGVLKPVGPKSEKKIYKTISLLANKLKVNLHSPWNTLKAAEQNLILYGKESKDLEYLKIDSNDSGVGLISILKSMYNNDSGNFLADWVEQYMDEETCPTCDGAGLNKIGRSFKLKEQNIFNLSSLSLNKLKYFFKGIENELSDFQKQIVFDVIKEIRNRLDFLIEVGLEYLQLQRKMSSLSGGESQRIRLATQIGSQLQGVTYILDEPSIGLHQRDNRRLIGALKKLRDQHNTVIVIEHDKEIMEAADFLIDIGPAAGKYGGEIIFASAPNKIPKNESVTGQFLSGQKKIELPLYRRATDDSCIELTGASGHNLKNVTIKIPLGKLVLISGVSGSGKSSLIFNTLLPALRNSMFREFNKTLPFKKISGFEKIDKIIEIDQKPIGRTPRSNPATYCGFYTEIRELFAATKEAQVKGYKIGRFSFNVIGGRCEDCGGSGVKVISLQFLPDVELVCDTCHGKRFNKDTLQIKFKGKTISDVLQLSIDDAVEFFKHQPKLYRKIKVLQEVGLGYISLGQPSTTISGGEAQRIKLSTELLKRDTGKTFYLLDEPTTGLHFQDIQLLLDVLQKIVDRGNTVVIIEHNLDVIKMADHIIEMGPVGGEEGGKIMFCGTPEEMVKQNKCVTAEFLKDMLL